MASAATAEATGSKKGILMGATGEGKMLAFIDGKTRTTPTTLGMVTVPIVRDSPADTESVTANTAATAGGFKSRLSLNYKLPVVGEGERCPLRKVADLQELIHIKP